MPEEPMKRIMSTTECPNCGSTEFLVESTFQEEAVARSIDASKISPKPGLTQDPITQVYVFSTNIGIQLGIDIQTTVTGIVLDACMQCGTIFAKEMYKGKGKLDVGQQQPPRHHMPPNQLGHFS